MGNRTIWNVAIVIAVVLLVVVVARYKAGDSSADTSPDAPRGDGARLPRLLDLGSDRCPSCKEMAPILKELAAKYSGRARIDFIDVWKDVAAFEKYEVRILPTQIFYDRDGNEAWRHEGYLGRDEIVAKFTELGAR